MSEPTPTSLYLNEERSEQLSRVKEQVDDLDEWATRGDVLDYLLEEYLND